jgi:hypothetical protein
VVQRGQEVQGDLGFVWVVEVQAYHFSFPVINKVGLKQVLLIPIRVRYTSIVHKEVVAAADPVHDPNRSVLQVVLHQSQISGAYV